MKYNILIVDDHWVVREGLKLILETSDNYLIVGEAEEGEEAIRIMLDKQPDVILLDLNMPGTQWFGYIETYERATYSYTCHYPNDIQRR